MEDTPFIETVEKAQGQEVDTVIVDYGLLNAVQIKRELKFLYSRNRLNVSITRAKKKCVIILSDVLLSTSFDIFDTQDTEDGYSYMHAIVEFAKKEQTYYEIPLSTLKSNLTQIRQEPIFKLNT